MGSSYIYLHGFASSPRSRKCRFFQDKFKTLGLTLETIDLNQPQFEQLTLTRQIDQVKNLINSLAYPQITLIGSSFGGLTAAWVGQLCPPVTRLILLAPAFNFKSYWHHHLSPHDRELWKHQGYRLVYHYSDQAKKKLHYNFLADLITYDESQLDRPIPTLIFHGMKDQTIPLQASEHYQRSRSWVELQTLNSGHSLTNQLELMWSHIQMLITQN